MERTNKLKKLFLMLQAMVLCNLSYAADGTITGKVKQLRTHQYLSNSGWDKSAWFCLDSPVIIGSCATSANACGGSHTLIAIPKDAEPELFSMILAAQMSQTTINVYVNDNYKYNGYCWAYWVETLTP